jgi:hypothetical protein
MYISDHNSCSLCSYNYEKIPLDIFLPFSLLQRSQPKRLLNSRFKCRIWCSHSSGYEEFYLLGYNAVQSVENQLMIRRNTSLPSSGSKTRPSKKPELRLQLASTLLLAWLSLLYCRWRWHVPSKRRSTFNGLHGVISQKIELFNRLKVSKVTSTGFEFLRAVNTKNSNFLDITSCNWRFGGTKFRKN